MEDQTVLSVSSEPATEQRRAPAGHEWKRELRARLGLLRIAPMHGSRRRYRFAALHEATADEARNGAVAWEARTRPWLQVGLPRTFAWREATLAISDLPAALDGFRVLHLSDAHLRHRWSASYDRLIDRVSSERPDIIVFSGDFIDNKLDIRPAFPVLKRLVTQLQARLGVFGILGNHDPDLLQCYLPSLNVSFLVGRRLVVRTQGAAVELIGLPGPARSDFDARWIRSLPVRAASVPRIVVGHYPDLFPPTQQLQADLYLSGHTHGGQICLPDGSPIITHDTLPRRFSKGIHRIGKSWFSVSQGLGMTGLRLRTFCAAEATLMTLAKG